MSETQNLTIKEHWNNLKDSVSDFREESKQKLHETIFNNDSNETIYFKLIIFYISIYIINILIVVIFFYVKYSKDKEYEKKSTFLYSTIISMGIFNSIFLALSLFIVPKYFKLGIFFTFLISTGFGLIGAVIGYYVGGLIGVKLQKKYDKDHRSDAEKKHDAIMKQSEENKPAKSTSSSSYKLIDKIKSDEKKLIALLEYKKKQHINPFKFKYAYALSFKVYINPQPPNTSPSYSKFTSLLNYGDKPNILYKADTNTLKITIKLNKAYTEELYMTHELQLQKWNHFIINYDHGTMDIFLNNKLVSTVKSIAPYMTVDDVVVGAKNGINGGIKNVKYYPYTIDLSTIKELFRM